jgi:hypothetical protein
MPKKPRPRRVIVHPFSRRQTPASPFSHSTLTLEQVAKVVAFADDVAFREGYRDGVLLARLPARLNSSFYSAVAELQPGERVWEGTRARREGESPRPFREVIREAKTPAQCVDVVLYRQDVVAELPKPDRDTWEIISINAYPDDEADPPLLPTTIVHNLHDRLLSDPLQPAAFWSETQTALARAVPYWGSRAMIQPPAYLNDPYTSPATPPANPSSPLVELGCVGATERSVWLALGAPNDGDRWCATAHDQIVIITHEANLATIWGYSDLDNPLLNDNTLAGVFLTIRNLIGGQNGN